MFNPNDRKKSVKRIVKLPESMTLDAL